MTNRSINEKADSVRKDNSILKGSKSEKEESAIRRVDSRGSEMSESLLPEVEEALEQIRKDPL